MSLRQTAGRVHVPAAVEWSFKMWGKPHTVSRYGHLTAFAVNRSTACQVYLIATGTRLAVALDPVGISPLRCLTAVRIFTSLSPNPNDAGRGGFLGRAFGV